MKVLDSYYVLVNKKDNELFLTENKTYTSQFDWCLKFKSLKQAEEEIEFYKRDESGLHYSSDYYAGRDVEVKEVKTVLL